MTFFNMDQQGRDDLLANQIINRMDSIKKINTQAFDELTQQIILARYPIAADRIRKLAWPQLQNLALLVSGFETQLDADEGPLLNAGMRPALVATLTGHFPFSLANPNRLNTTPQVCLSGAEGGVNVVKTYLNSNLGSDPSSTITLAFTVVPTRVMKAQRTDLEVLMCHYNMQAAADKLIKRVSLTTAGVIQQSNLQTPALANVLFTAGAATFVDRPLLENFCDGTNLWAFEYDDTNNVLRVHKINLATGGETIQVINDFEGTVEAMFYAAGDQYMLACSNVAGPVSVLLLGKLVDGSAPAALSLNQVLPFVSATTPPFWVLPLTATGAPTVQLRGFQVGGSIENGKRFRMFLTPNSAGTDLRAIHVVTVDPHVTPSTPTALVADATAKVVTAFCLGNTEGWPVGANEQDRAAVGFDGTRVFLIPSTTPIMDLQLFSLSTGRQISAVFPTPTRVTGLSALSQMNAKGANMIALATTLYGTHLLELSV